MSNRKDCLSTPQTLQSIGRYLTLAALAFGLIGCSQKPAQQPEQLKPESTAAAAAQRQVRADRIRTYFTERAPQKGIVATTRTTSGQGIDLIPRGVAITPR